MVNHVTLIKKLQKKNLKKRYSEIEKKEKLKEVVRLVLAATVHCINMIQRVFLINHQLAIKLLESMIQNQEKVKILPNALDLVHKTIVFPVKSFPWCLNKPSR